MLKKGLLVKLMKNSKRGFISTIFLIILILMSSIYIVLFNKYETTIKSIENLEIVNHRFNDEIKVINFVKCKMKKNQLESKIYTVDNDFYKINIYENNVECIYNNDLIIKLLIKEDKIIDYLIE
jgi:hypothetical protein